MKTKRSIFTIVSGKKNGSRDAQSDSVSGCEDMRTQGENDSQNSAPNTLDMEPSAFCESLTLRAATIDELLSSDVTPCAEPYGDTNLAARRLAAWCRASTGNDQALFERRLVRDGLSIADASARLGAVSRTGATPAWLADAGWILAALESSNDRPLPTGNADDAGNTDDAGPCAFEPLLAPIADQAQARLHAAIGERVLDHLSTVARAGLRRGLLQDLSELCAPALYERFSKARSAAASDSAPPPSGTALFDRFAGEMKTGGFRQLFTDKPVLLRLIATVTGQWLDATLEFLVRLEADLPTIRGDLLAVSTTGKVAKIEGDLSDPHNFGRSVRVITFADGARALYKPKDLRLDVVWGGLIERLNRAGPPVTLRAVRAIARDGYGWTEFVTHDGCDDESGLARFFHRAGALLALFHVFAATDMHQENIIAAGDHPVPVDLETLLQPSPEEHKAHEPESEAFDAAMEIVGTSVMTVGLLPAYGRSVDNNVFAMGGMTADWGARTVIRWNDINTDAMRPAKAKEPGTTNTNLPHSGGRYAKFADHIADFIEGFEDYAHFLARQIHAAPANLFAGFAGLPVRKVVRPTRFYYMLLQRLRNHQQMDDGATWSAQADFIARLSPWDKETDPLWPLLRAERAALLALNVPHFVTPSDGTEIHDVTGASARTAAIPGLARAMERAKNLNADEIAWQTGVIRENANAVLQRAASPAQTAAAEIKDTSPGTSLASAREQFLTEADEIADEITRQAIRRGASAAWIGLDWLGDAEVFQLVCLGPDLYNGTSGIALFLAAHAAVTGHAPSAELALAALSHLRKTLKSRNAARFARAVGTGGALGLGAIIYAFTVIAKSLDNDGLLADAESAAGLFTDALIAADKQLDVMGGSAGGILGLLRLHRDTRSAEALTRATKCGEHLLAQPRVGPEGRRSWPIPGKESKVLNGMSHGAAGFAYALASLAATTGREDFAQAAAECIAFEDSTYDAERHNWPDLRSSETHWPCQWCHGATGIGLARLGMSKWRGGTPSASADIENAVASVQHNRPTPVDTLCCGTLGGIEFLCEAADTLERDDLREAAARRLLAVLDRAKAAGDYRWNNGRRQFNLGLFRGLSGVGYTLLRQATLQQRDTTLPNVLIWE
jgi:type 2 lantibiotic biosynthesis protein LanM